MKKVITTFGRMNPPTSGHQKLVDKINSLAKGADARIYLSHSQNNKKDPLDYNTKIALAQKAFGSSVIKSNAKTIIQVMQELQKAGYTDVTVVVGSDRVTEFNTLLNKYNGKDYTFNSIKITSAGQRDPDADDVSGMSASKLRGLAKEGNFDTFKKGLPSRLQSDAKKIYDQLRSIMEQEQLDEYAVLSQQQRMKRARMMRRIAKKVARMRKIRAKRMADTTRLMKRSRKQAIQFLRKRVAGQRGQAYRDLGRAEKITIDKLVAKKSAVIDKLAKRLLPKVRKAEVARVAAARAPKTEEVTSVKSYKELIERMGPNEKRINNEIQKDKQKNFKSYDRMRDLARVQDVQLRNRGITKEAYESLEKKAAAINVSIDKIFEVYDNATIDISKDTTEQQQRFNAVNHFVAEERNKVAEPTGDLKKACWKGYTAIGMKMKNGKKVPNCVPVKEETQTGELQKKNLKSILSKRKEAKSTAGAGEWGTDELVKNYVKDTPYMSIEGYCPDTGKVMETLMIEEAEHEGKKVKLNDPFRLPAGSKKKFGVYVKNDKGNVVKVTFGDPNMEIKRDDPERRKAFRSRHSCDDDIGPKWKARYWSCYQWRAGKKVDN